MRQLKALLRGAACAHHLPAKMLRRAPAPVEHRPRKHQAPAVVHQHRAPGCSQQRRRASRMAHNSKSIDGSMRTGLSAAAVLDAVLALDGGLEVGGRVRAEHQHQLCRGHLA
jgi:hypothetical protein